MSGERGRTVIILQARMSSRRLPGKVLLPLEGSPMIVRQWERLRRCVTVDDIVLATSTDPSDDPLVEVAQAQGLTVFRGSLDDVLRRFTEAAESAHAEVVVRITGDCPLISPSVIDQIVTAFHNADADYLSNTMDPTYPDGLDVEVVRASVLTEVNSTTEDSHEREHVTLGVYRHPERYQIVSFQDPSGLDRSYLRWTVDNSDDFTFVSEVYRGLWHAKHDFDYLDVLDYLEMYPELVRTSDDAKRNAALDGLDTGVMNHQHDGSVT